MGVFMAFAIGILAGAVIGGIGMFLLIKETQTDLSIENEEDDEKLLWVSVDCPWETEETKEVKYGEF